MPKMIAPHWSRSIAERRDLAEDVDTECFFLTYAHIFALELNHPSQANLRARLVAYGRE
jgi:hypothetical protein